MLIFRDKGILFLSVIMALGLLPGSVAWDTSTPTTSSMAMCPPYDLEDLRGARCGSGSKGWRLISAARMGMRSGCLSHTSSFDSKSVKECRDITCSLGLKTFEYEVSSKKCIPKLCSTDAKLTASDGYEVYSLVDNPPSIVLIQLNDPSCPTGQGKIHMLKTNSNCSYHGPCPDLRVNVSTLVLSNVPPTHQTGNLSLDTCVDITPYTENYWLRGPVNVTRGATCGDYVSCTTKPQQIRLTLGRPSGSSYTVEWATQGPADAILRVSPSPTFQSEITQVTGSTESYTVCGQDCEDKYNHAYCSPLLHHATIQGLLPDGNQYYYQVGGTNEEYGDIAKSDIKSFTTVPSGGEKSYPFHIGILGDMGQTVFSEGTCEEFKSDTEIQMALLVGDMSYADGYGPRWDSWGRMVQECFSRIPVLYMPGNHEVELEMHSKEAFKGYRARFHMPGVREETFSYTPGNASHWDGYGDVHYDYGSSFYSIDVGPVHFIVINSYTDSDPTSKQYRWLLDDLKSIDRERTPWVIVSMHAPIYNSNEKHQQEKPSLQVQKHMEPLFYEYRVDAVFAGHVHAYERFDRTYNFKKDPNGPYYVTIGDAGNRERLYDAWPVTIETSLFQNALFYGSGKLSIMNDSHARWEWQSNTPEGAWDTAWFVKTSSSNGNRSNDSKDWNIVAPIVAVSVGVIVTICLFLKLGWNFGLGGNSAGNSFERMDDNHVPDAPIILQEEQEDIGNSSL
ncbi:hypothetical protein AAMO2058_001721200 [Amorphochlora amoebiformis]